MSDSLSRGGDEGAAAQRGGGPGTGGDSDSGRDGSGGSNGSNGIGTGGHGAMDTIDGIDGIDFIDSGTTGSPGTTGAAGPEGAAGATVGTAVSEEDLLIHGTVCDAFGVALPRAVVTLARNRGGRQIAKTRSAPDGAFRLQAPELGDYLLAVYAPQLGEQRVTVTMSGSPVQVEFRIEVPGTVLE
ncbi:carboxypeptidase-like regulatory domain-containing protein [Streptomyces sp. YIM 98790]|uniref:carboxypeptidase-like regulatory domain-containing protein n=1 Tax=Streptomyces sp. YIM 98790 TaxID=2689077 RepID=UPI0014098F40|nr:carboxypeptidase-like regulatory domain-containing protein [Streptomyces sp. YIM 98790]